MILWLPQFHEALCNTNCEASFLESACEKTAANMWHWKWLMSSSPLLGNYAQGSTLSFEVSEMCYKVSFLFLASIIFCIEKNGLSTGIGAKNGSIGGGEIWEKIFFVLKRKDQLLVYLRDWLVARNVSVFWNASTWRHCASVWPIMLSGFLVMSS